MINETIKKLYNELIYNLLVEEKVEKIVCCHSNYDAQFFDDICVDKERGVVIVHKGNLKHDFKGFSFDSSVDFAECLAQIEKGIYLANHGVNESNYTFGMAFTFSKEKQAYIDNL